MAGESEESGLGTYETPVVKELREKLEETEGKVSEYLQMAQRLQADFDNFRKRIRRENDDFKAFAVAEMISEMLDIVDDFDRALLQVKEVNDFVMGVMGIRQNLMKVLESRGLKEIPTDGKFDPSYHEALGIVEGDTEGDIVEVFQKGYCLGNKVLRYSKVKVTTKKHEIEETEVNIDV
ncbi:MAG: nucleotide exchange factor GrpE [archaeon]|nr:nucleotide exchange factor GrpE [archaeon]